MAVVMIYFCLPGETSEEVWTTMRRLQAKGVSAILDYAAEDDTPPADQRPTSSATGL